MSSLFRRPPRSPSRSSASSIASPSGDRASEGERKSDFPARSTGRRGRKLLDSEQALYDYAVGVLGRSMRTEAELRRLMRQRVEDAAAAEPLFVAVIARLRSHQYLSDVRYAASFASLRRDGRKLGPRRIAQDLRQKGVAADIIAQEVSSAFAETDELSQARAFLTKKRVTLPERGDERGKARVLRMLVRAGFSPSIGYRILSSGPLDDADLSDS